MNHDITIEIIQQGGFDLYQVRCPCGLFKRFTQEYQAKRYADQHAEELLQDAMRSAQAVEVELEPVQASDTRKDPKPDTIQRWEWNRDNHVYPW